MTKNGASRLRPGLAEVTCRAQVRPIASRGQRSKQLFRPIALSDTRTGGAKLTTIRAPRIAIGTCTDTHKVIWLALTWLTLIALWGISERWGLGDAIRQTGRRLRAQHHPQGAAPFDWARR